MRAAPHVRHPNIGQDNIVAFAQRPLQTLSAAQSGLHLVVPLTQDFLDAVENDLLVVNDQDLLLCHLFFPFQTSSP